MSSRAGNVVYIDDLLNEAKNGVKNIMQGRVAEETVDTVAEKVGFAAIAFGILKSSRMNDTAFELDYALKLEGDTGPYLQYTMVRAGSVLEKAKSMNIKKSYTVPSGWQITNLERYLYRFEEVVIRACENLEPHHIATYLIELASFFNSFYTGQKIVDETDTSSPYRIVLTEAFRKVMGKGLYLLGIESPEKQVS